MKCRVCDENDFSVAVDLQSQPCGNLFLSSTQVGQEPFYPLKVIYCNKCKTAQLDYTVKKEEIYSDQNTYLSGMTKTLADHFDKTAKEVDDTFFKNQKEKTVLDVGSNDGTQLKSYKALGYDVLGVEASSVITSIAQKAGINTIAGFFNEELAKTLNTKFDVINASGVFFHLEELHSVTEGIRLLLKEDGVFVVQFLYMKNIMENLAFDQIYHEHLLYYTLHSINVLLKRHGLELFDSYFSPIHGGSVIAYASHKGKRKPTERLQKMREEEELSGCNELKAYQEFAKKVEELKQENIRYLEEKKREGKTIFGMGAPVKGNTLLNYFGINKDLISCLVEKNTLRRNLFSPGKHLPVIIEDELKEHPDVYYVLAWNFKKEILARYKHLIDKGVEFYFPINPKNAI